MSTEVPMAVPDRLRRLVSEVTVLSTTPGGSGDRHPLVHVPDADTSLIFRTTSAGRGDLLVIGPRTHASYYVGKDFPLCLRIRLHPGAARPLLGVPVNELVDRVIPLDELWGAPSDELTTTLAEAGGDPDLVIKHIEAALLTRIATQSWADLARGELVRAAAEALEERPGHRREPVPAIARRLAVSERHLRDLFADGIGLPPKRFQRIGRVREILARADGGRRWAQLAVSTGYYDQSHMTAEFRTLMGVTPTAFFAGRLPALQPC